MAGVLFIANPRADAENAAPIDRIQVNNRTVATTFNVLTPSESALLAAELPGTDYLLVTHNGLSITSAGWLAGCGRFPTRTGNCFS